MPNPNLKSKTSEEISKSAGNFGIPGFKWPLYSLNAKYS